MKKIGIDLGSSSIGWYVSDDNITIKKGVVTFDSGMVKGKSGYSSPTEDRRVARSKRNLIRAKKYRKIALLRILIEKNYVPISQNELEVWSKYKKGRINKFPENNEFLKWLACDFTYLDGGINYKNPYELRVKALDSKLHKHEFGRVLYHIIQRRGYKDIGEKNDETKKQIKRRDEDGFQQAINKTRTIGEALNNEFLNKGLRTRNQYPYRAEYEKELETICKSQGLDISKNNNGIYNNEFVGNIWHAIIWQRPLRSQKGNIGKCTFEPKKLRCPISHPVFEVFRAWQFINTIKTIDTDGVKHPLAQDIREKLFEEFLKKDSTFKFEDIRTFVDKKLSKPQKYNYPIDNKGKYDTTVAGMPICKELIKIFKDTIFGNSVKEAILNIESFNIFSHDNSGGFGNAPKIINNKYSIYDIWHCIFSFDEDFLQKFAVEKLGIANTINKKSNKETSPLVTLKGKFLQGYADLSLHAMCKIIPFLKQGCLYNEAVVLAKIPDLIGSNWEIHKGNILKIIKEANHIYYLNKVTIEITNSLIDKWKGDKYFAVKDYTYTLQDDDIASVEICVSNYINEYKHKDLIPYKDDLIKSALNEYQSFFHDETRSYRKLATLSDIFNNLLEQHNIHIDSSKLYHHSNIENIYTKKCKTNKTSDNPQLPTSKDKFGNTIEILPPAIIDSIKNPMFNKAMSILRKLMNELIKTNVIDKDTEVIVELARELNDNNKRIAIERYNKDLEKNRAEYRAFLQEYTDTDKVDKYLPEFQLWTEQIFAEKKDISHYELWKEQKGQCMYTGKMIPISAILANEVEIMHTIPRSILPDDTKANMTIGYAHYNRDLQKQKLPTQCDNYDKDVEGWGTCIKSRIDKWKDTRDYYKQEYEKRQRAKGNEDENAKNKRIQEKHYYKLYYDYWKEKIDRFEATDINDKWVRRQLTDTQMISKYAREFLKTYFKKVSVQKGSTTAMFRKFYGIQEQNEIKDRAIHTHHAIDAFILTLVPSNSSYRDKLIKEYYNALDKKGNALDHIRKREIQNNFNAQKIKELIENSTLIYNYEKDNLFKQTIKKNRKRGQLQFLKDKETGKFVYQNGKKVLLISKGDTARSTLYDQTYLGKIRDVERDSNEKEIYVKNLDLNIKVKGLPAKRINNDWQYKTEKGKDAYLFVVRKRISDVLSNIDNIVDPCIRELIRKQKGQEIIKDFQGNPIRHVRIKVKVGKEVKERINYRSKYDYKNKFYSGSGSIPYAILLQKGTETGVDRKLLHIASNELAKIYSKYRYFDIEQYIKNNNDYKEYIDWNKTLLKIGQRVLVLNNDEEYSHSQDLNFIKNRLYTITQFSEGCIWLNYHLNALSTLEIKKSIALKKDLLMTKYEKELNIPEVEEDNNIIDITERNSDYKERKYRFDTIENSFRLKRLIEYQSIEYAKLVKSELDKFKAIPSKIEIEGETMLLKTSNWNFLIEGIDFNMNIDGSITFKKNRI